MDLDGKFEKISIVFILILILVVSGCTGGSDQPEEEQELQMTEFSFASSITGKDDYVEHSDQFNPKNTVYLYFEVKGFEKEDGKVSIKQDLKVTGPDEEVIHDETIVNDILNVGDQEKIWFNNHFRDPDGAFKPGEYNIELTITDKRTDKTLKYTETFTVEEIEESGSDEEPELEIREFSYAESIDGPKDFVSHSNEYASNQTVKIYFEVWGLTVENDTVELQQTRKVIDPDGEVLEQKTVIDSEVSGMSEEHYIWGRNYIEPPENGFKKGTYTVQLEVLDKKDQSTTEITKEFLIVEES